MSKEANQSTKWVQWTLRWLVQKKETQNPQHISTMNRWHIIELLINNNPAQCTKRLHLNHLGEWIVTIVIIILLWHQTKILKLIKTKNLNLCNRQAVTFTVTLVQQLEWAQLINIDPRIINRPQQFHPQRTLLSKEPTTSINKLQAKYREKI